jgi:hypothetical protein
VRYSGILAGVNQFLELYLYNMVHTKSAATQSWISARSYVPFAASNEGVLALLDVYQWIGLDAMTNAYRAVYLVRPPYGQPLSTQCQQVFVDQAPAALKSQVAAKMAKVVY